MTVETNIYAAVAGYVGRPDQSGRVGVFRRPAEGEWQHALPDLEAFTVSVHPRHPDIVLAGTADGVWRSTDRGATFARAESRLRSRAHGFSTSSWIAQATATESPRPSSARRAKGIAPSAPSSTWCTR